jgi:hypothetical protein
LSATEDRFSVDFNSFNGKVFVYGREVDDFRTVDYEAISMLNVSSTQELYKKILELEKATSTIEMMKKEVQNLKVEVDKFQDLKKDIELLKASINTTANK